MESEAVTMAKELFAAYNAQGPNPWKTFDGRDVPKWDELGEQVRAKWTASGARALELARQDVLGEDRPAVTPAE